MILKSIFIFEDDNTPDETVDVNDLIGNQLN